MKKISFLLIALLCSLLLIGCAREGYGPSDPPENLPAESGAHIEVSVPEPLPEDAVISFAACGDNIMYYGNNRDAKKCAIEGGREYNYAPIYENIKHIIEGADISFINQETPMSTDMEYSSYPHFNTPRDLAHDIIEAGFDVVNLATNHMLDAYSDGLKSTIEFWNTLPVTTIGGYLDRSDYETVRIIEKDGIRIGFLSFTYSTNGRRLASGYDIVIPYIDRAEIAERVNAAKEVSDVLIVSMHWGSEYKFKPNTEQKDLASMMAGLGVDVIIGHHPHVLQPIEWIESPNGDGHKMLCVYSLGNLAAEQADDFNLVGGIMTFNIVRKKGEISIEEPLLLPTVYYYNKSFYKNSVHLMENFTEDMAKSLGLSYYGNSTTVEKLRSYVTKTIAPEFLPDYLKK